MITLVERLLDKVKTNREYSLINPETQIAVGYSLYYDGISDSSMASIQVSVDEVKVSDIVMLNSDIVSELRRRFTILFGRLNNGVCI